MGVVGGLDGAGCWFCCCPPSTRVVVAVPRPPPACMRLVYALACGRVNIPTHTPITYNVGGGSRVPRARTHHFPASDHR